MNNFNPNMVWEIDNIQDNFTRKISNVRVIDGDTIECDIDLGFHITIREMVRLAGIDTPERSDKFNWLNAKEFVEIYFDFANFNELETYITTNKQGSFKRWLGTIKRVGDHKSLNEQLLIHDLAEVRK